MLEVMTVVGTRPEIIRLSRVIARLDQVSRHVLVHTGQSFDHELSEVFFSELGIRKPDHFLHAAGATAAETIAQVIIGLDQVITAKRPDAILFLGDTNSCLGVIAAKRRQIPIFHLEAGNRCFDLRVPEEVNRRIVDHTADIHLTYSEIAKSYLLREGIAPDQVICVGSPMREVLDFHADGIASSDILRRLALEPQKYFVVSCHREETVDDPERLARLFQILGLLCDKYGWPVIFSTHPRTQKRIAAGEYGVPPHVRLLKPFGFLDYVRLQCNSAAVLSDSGTITEESSILNFPALNLRETHERPEGFEEGSVMFTGLSPDRVLDGLRILETQGRGAERTLRMVHDYEPKNVSEKVVRIILSYTDFVRSRVWHR